MLAIATAALLSFRLQHSHRTLRLGLEASTWGPGIAITMMAIEVIATAEGDGVESCGKPASTKKS